MNAVSTCAALFRARAAYQPGPPPNYSTKFGTKFCAHQDCRNGQYVYIREDEAQKYAPSTYHVKLTFFKVGSHHQNSPEDLFDECWFTGVVQKQLTKIM